MAVRDFLFQSPKMAVFLFIALFIAWCFWELFHYRKKILSSFSSLYQEMMIPRSSSRYLSKAFFIAAAWVCATLALMQPAGNARYPAGFQKSGFNNEGVLTNQRSNQEVILLIDTSTSMSVKDARSNKSRLDFAKEIAEEIVTALSGQNVAVYAFTSQEEPMVSSTLDYLFSRIVIKGLVLNDPGVAGTSIVNALESLASSLTARQRPTNKAVIMLTDGGDTKLEAMSSSDRTKTLNKILDQYKNIPGGDIQIYPVGIGTKQGGQIPDFVYQGKTIQSVLNDEILKSLSDGTYGKYYYANSYTAYSLAKDLVQNLNEGNHFESVAMHRKSSKQNVSNAIPLIYDLYFQVPLGLAIIFLGLYLWLPDVRKAEALQ